MTPYDTFRRLLSVSTLIALSGCAPAYHAYPCGQMPLGYCAHPPVPYTRYSTCPTPIANCCYQESQRATPSAEPLPVPPREIGRTAPPTGNEFREEQIIPQPLLPMGGS